MPPRDTVDFVVAVAIGAALGWSVVTLIRSEQDRPVSAARRRTVRRLRGRRAPEANLLGALGDELGRVAREAGEQLTQGVLGRLGSRLVDAGSKRGR